MYRSFARPLMVVGALALLAGCNKTYVTQTDSDPTASVPALTDTSAPVFVQKAGGNDMFEVQAAQAAIARTRNADIKAYAQMMVDAHTKSTNDLKAAIAVSAMTLAPPLTLPLELQSKLEALSATDASSFNETYIGQQVAAHEEALSLLRRYATEGDTPAIKTFAAAAVPIVEDHLAKARDLQSKL